MCRRRPAAPPLLQVPPRVCERVAAGQPQSAVEAYGERHRRGGIAINVLYVLPYLEAAGTEYHVLHLTQELLAAGHGVSLLAPPGPLAPAFAALGVTHEEFPAFNAAPRRALTAIEDRIRQAAHAVDVIHAHAGIEVLYAVRRALRGQARRPAVVFTVHSYFGRFAAWDYRRAARLGGRWADAVIAVSEADAATLRRHSRQAAARLAVVRNGVPDAWRTPGPARDELRARLAGRLNLPPGERLCLAAGRLTRQKGFDTLLGALGRYAGVPVTVLLAGDGPLRATLERQARALGVLAGAEAAGRKARVVFLGARSDVPDLLRAVDAFVLPSRMEGLSLALLEAHGAGVPCLTTDVGGNAEVVRPGETGLIVPPDDPEALADALAELLADAGRLAALGRSARQRFEACFTAERMARETLRVYEHALRRCAE